MPVPTRKLPNWLVPKITGTVPTVGKIIKLVSVRVYTLVLRTLRFISHLTCYFPQSVSNLWTIAELTSDGGSNSVENNNIGEFAERGRGFSGTNTLALSLDRGNVLPLITVSPEIVPSSSESIILRGTKKESGRSLKLTEMLEPVLRGTRQDAPPKTEMEDRKHELMEESQSSNRGFTVQFLPERLAGILAQAERYARMTLLPLISQYTPSFIGGGGGARSDRPKYFPPLGRFTRKNLIRTKSVLPLNGFVISRKPVW